MNIYVAHPYAGDIAGNVKKVKAICRQLKLKEGHSPVAPHLALSYLDEATERETALEEGLKLLELCDVVYSYGRVTTGMSGEIKRARELKIPIFYKEI